MVLGSVSFDDARYCFLNRLNRSPLADVPWICLVDSLNLFDFIHVRILVNTDIFSVFPNWIDLQRSSPAAFRE